MKIGIMLRAIDEKQGVGIYTQNLLDHLLRLDSANEYVLYYRNPDYLGRYAGHKNVLEKLVLAPNKLLWDQVKIPFHAWLDGVDIIFQTKFSVPFFTRAKTIMALHGAGWFVHPELFKWHSVLYQRCLMPLYCRKAAGLIANSELTRADFIRIMGVNPVKVRTINLAADDRFRRLENAEVLKAAKRKHELPERFILSVIKYDLRKNFHNLIEAFRICHEKTPCKLVVAGIGCEKYCEEFKLREIGLNEDVRFLGWVEQEDLVPLYNLADFLFFPSFYETFGIPVCEAIACGCPVVTAKTGSLPEIAGDAGVVVDPYKPKEMAETLHALWTNEALRKAYAEKAHARSNTFSWSRNAMETLEVFEAIACGSELTSLTLSEPFVGSRLDGLGRHPSD